MDFSTWNKPRRDAVQRMAEHIQRIPPTGEVKNLPCPICKRFLKLTNSMFGRYYKCPTRGCAGKSTAFEDGSPKSLRIKNPTLLNKIDAMADYLEDL